MEKNIYKNNRYLCYSLFKNSYYIFNIFTQIHSYLIIKNIKLIIILF